MQGKSMTVTPPDMPARPEVHEKRIYEPHSPQEEFIVPLLRREIEDCIERYATPALGLGKAVDIGSGGQPFRSLLEGIGYSYCSVDVSVTDGPVDAQCAIDEPLPESLLRRAPFDFGLCTEVLEHVADWHRAFSNLTLLLAPRGRVLITAPHFYQLHEEPYDFWRPTLHAVTDYARRFGFATLYQKAAGDARDVLGTALANCQFVATSRRLTDRALAKAARAMGRLATRTLRSGRLRSHVRVDGPLYLSNVVVLEKFGADR